MLSPPASRTAMAKAPVALPPTWKSLTIRGVQHRGERYMLTVTKDGRTITAERPTVNRCPMATE
ncbi:MAG: hypothetical protein H8F28_05565 [Fibrella sp.]|nr:hypothetical protein [Armatimonadota bacterium]